MNATRWLGRVGAGVLAGALAVGLLGCFLKPRPKKAFTESCTLDTDCDSADCAGPGNICSKSCTFNKDCGGDLVCRQKPDGSGDHCAQKAGAPPNGSCAQSVDCENEHCLKKNGDDSAPGICSRYCATPDDCPDGMKICDLINDTATVKMCLPGGSSPTAARPSYGAAAKVAPRGVATPTPTTPPVVAPTAAVAASGATLAPRPTAKPTTTAKPAILVPVKPKGK